MKVYLDNAATTPMHPKVFEKMKKYFREDFGNPSSVHSFGRKARVAIESARETVAEFINAKPGEIYFVSSGTEANNFALFGISKTEFSESKRNHIITSAGEHVSVLDCCSELEKTGFEITYSPLTNYSNVNSDLVNDSITSATFLISLIHINNETGAINNLMEIVRKINNQNIHFHSDAVQSFGKTGIDVKEFGLSALSASGHKIYGPKGTGILYVKSGTPISPLLQGGSQERNRRGGTENVAGIIGFAEAVKIANAEMSVNEKKIRSLRKFFVDGIEFIDKDGLVINGTENNSPYIISLTFDSNSYNNDMEAMLMFLDLNGIAASNGAACSSGTLKFSHVILNSGKSENDAAGTIRFSLGPDNTKEEIDYTLEVLKKMVKKFSK